MKKVITLLSLSLLLFSCERIEKVETPGNIPGMGDTEGALETTPYKFTEGIEFVGTITGFDESLDTETNQVALKSTETSLTGKSIYGSGGQWIKVSVTLKNTTNWWRTLFFPPGLIFEVNNKEYQNAILLQWAWTSLEPYEEKTIVLYMYCINKGKLGSDAFSNFNVLGTTDSEEMRAFLNLIGWKKINVEFFTTGSGLKNTSEFEYSEVANVLQEAVWSITNGSGLSDEHKAFIKSLPDLEPGTYPEGLNDVSDETPLYFKEYSELAE
ncbi:MAG: hypothetical protein JXB49_31060 [Bacteroidales bacterium]|nr:hypothetical protein [Bacteroidales bacterium]MBN2820720.1 hypothetical protein [Bacteroidales bacterium]